MKRKIWSPREKFLIVLEGLKGQTPLAELCNRHQISQGMYYKWREQLLQEGDKIFVHGGPDQHEQRLQAEVRRLKGIIGELTVELKKTAYDDGGR